MFNALKDLQGFTKKVEKGGDPKVYPHTKEYCGGHLKIAIYGGIALAAIGYATVFVLDFLHSKPNSGNNGNRDRTQRHDNRQRR